MIKQQYTTLLEEMLIVLNDSLALDENVSLLCHLSFLSTFTTARLFFHPYRLQE